MVNEYLKSVNQDLNHEMVKILKNQAIKDDIPIITDEGIRLLIQIISVSKAKKVLEIGTAIGYSSILMALFSHASITTIERDASLYNTAKNNIDLAGLSKRIRIILGDAKEVTITEKDFDIVFIDAAKSSYIDFFEKFSQNLKPQGIIISDNLLFKGLVANPKDIESRNKKQLVRKIDKYNHFIVKHPDFNTYIYNIGDGMSISIKK